MPAPPRRAPRSFQLLITTRLRDPRFPFDVIRNATVVNFSITRGQLSELLITTTLRHELPDLEAEHLVLMRQRAKGEADLLELEDQVGCGDGYSDSGTPWVHGYSAVGAQRTTTVNVAHRTEGRPEGRGMRALPYMPLQIPGALHVYAPHQVIGEKIWE